jgi:hypothetical protein
MDNKPMFPGLREIVVDHLKEKGLDNKIIHLIGPYRHADKDTIGFTFMRSDELIRSSGGREPFIRVSVEPKVIENYPYLLSIIDEALDKLVGKKSILYTGL